MGNVIRRKFSSAAKPDEIPPILKGPAALQSFFVKPPLLDSEDPKSYWQLFDLLVEEISPADAIEWLLFKDVVSLNWEIARLYRVKPALIDAGRSAAVAKLFMPFGEASRDDMKFHGACDEARDSAEKWANPATKKQVEAQLRNRSLNSDSILATSFAMQVGSLEAAEKILCALELRRNRALQEIADHRQRGNEQSARGR